MFIRFICFAYFLSFAVTHSVSAQELVLSIDQIAVQPHAKDISFVDNLGLDFLVEHDLEMQLAIGHCYPNQNDSSIPDLSNRCKKLVEIGDTIQVPANPTNSPKNISLAQNFLFSFDMDQARQLHPSKSIHQVLRELQIYSYDWGADQEMISIAQPSSCLYQLLVERTVRQCQGRSTGKIFFTYTLSIPNYETPESSSGSATNLKGSTFPTLKTKTLRR